MNTFLINRTSPEGNNGLWRFDPAGKDTFTRETNDAVAALDPDYRMLSIGGYLLKWGAKQTVNGEAVYPYELSAFDPRNPSSPTGKVIQSGNWPLSKFYGKWRTYLGPPGGQDKLDLYAMGTYVLFLSPTPGRGTYELYNFDPNFLQPNTSDPLILEANQTGSFGFARIQSGHTLVPFNNYVLDILPDKINYRIWSFDPQDKSPLSMPAVAESRLDHHGISPDSEFVAIGDNILVWRPGDYSYTLFRMAPTADRPFAEVLAEGCLPDAMQGTTSLVAFQPRVQAAQLTGDPTPGTIDYMRKKVKHVVFYMLESRSFDNTVGWLYADNPAAINAIGSNEPYNGTSTSYYNELNGQRHYVSQFEGGKLSTDYDLNDQQQDPYHSNSDGLIQMFRDGFAGYRQRAEPDMSGFVKNNYNPGVMLTLSPEQLPVMNGLAKNFASSDAWFSSVPGGTTINRAFSVTGSALDRLYTWEGGAIYDHWTDFTHRQSIWKLLYSHGISDFKIYNAMKWLGFPYTYHLFLEGQVPSIDKAAADYQGTVDQFLTDAKNGTLPAFSYVEPVWVSPTATTSYHPKTDLVPAEQQLNKIYNALREGPNWEETLLVVTFSKPGGMYDHAPPPYAVKPWPNDVNNSFAYDLLGPRVPAIFVSPWIKPNTVIRSGTDTPFDSTSFAATLLEWFGIPRGSWALGDRMDEAPTFAPVFQETTPRNDAPTLPNPYDKSFPPGVSALD